MNRRLLPLLACVVIVMIGVGISLPVVPFYVERLALDTGAAKQVVLHVGLLTAAYPLVQLVFAPVWGRLSDRIGRRPLIAVGVLGFVVTQSLFGLATGLPMLYGARIAGGALSAALLPVASAYVADVTGEDQRTRGIAWLNTAVGLGIVVGPGLGAVLMRTDLHLRWRFGHLMFDAFSVPFLVASMLAVAALILTLLVLPASRTSRPIADPGSPGARRPHAAIWVLATTAAAHLGITLFEATFALFAQERLRFGPGQVATVFTVCGLVMIPTGLAAASAVRRLGELWLFAIGFGLMGGGLLLLVTAGSMPLALLAVTLLGAGMASVGPSLAALVTVRRDARIGAALGQQSAAQSAGQVAGPLVGTALLGWHAQAPYVLAGLLMVSVCFLLSRHAWAAGRAHSAR